MEIQSVPNEPSPLKWVIFTTQLSNSYTFELNKTHVPRLNFIFIVYESKSYFI